MKEGIIKLRQSRIIEPEEMREREYGKGEEGRTLTRESKSEFTPRGRDLPTFPLLGCLVLGCNRQAQSLIIGPKGIPTEESQGS